MARGSCAMATTSSTASGRAASPLATAIGRADQASESRCISAYYTVQGIGDCGDLTFVTRLRPRGDPDLAFSRPVPRRKMLSPSALVLLAAGTASAWTAGAGTTPLAHTPAPAGQSLVQHRHSLCTVLLAQPFRAPRALR